MIALFMMIIFDDDGYKVSEAKAGELLVKIASVFVVAELCNQAISR